MLRTRVIRVCAGFLSAVLVVSGCAAPTVAQQSRGPALFYAKDGALYVSAPPGSPGRRLTDGPGDTQPTASPDGRRIAYVHKANAADPGGELWVLEVSSGERRRLVDPAALVPAFEGDLAQVSTPRWAPVGNSIAFLKSTFGGGGFLLTAAADIGVLTAPPAPLFADFGYAWSPDGKRVAWAGGRSDVSPVDVSVYTVGDASVPIAQGTNATSVGYAADGAAVLFANPDATGMDTGAAPFALPAGGIYSVAPPAAPMPVTVGTTAFADVQSLPSGAVAFTEWSADQTRKAIAVLEGGIRRDIAETPADAPAPLWADASTVIYLGTDPDRPLLVRRGAEEPTRVDGGVDSFAWG